MRPTGTVTLPGLIDLQVNGYGGHDVNSDEISPEVITALVREMWARGVTTFLPTIVTASEEKIIRILRAIAIARDTDPRIAHSIAGVHMEGPALSVDDGPRGAHDSALMRDPDLGELDRWQDAAGGIVRIVTIAPERPGAIDYITGATQRGVSVSIGHSSCTPDEVRAAVAAGASLSTHLGNGTQRELPRHPNHIWAQLAADELTAMLIADGHHVPADALTAMIRAKSAARCVLTSDAVMLGGLPPGVYETPVGGQVTVEDTGRISLTGTDLLAGSGSSLLACLDWAVGHLPFDAETIISMVTSNPARMLGVDERIGGTGDRVVIDRAGGVSRVRTTWLLGEQVYSSSADKAGGEVAV